jgi:hypothetical protein
MYSLPAVPLMPADRFLSDHAVKYQFIAYPIDAAPAASECVYVFAAAGVPVYIGQAASLRQRLASHDKISLAKLMGASELWVHTPDYALGIVRYQEAERRLINTYNPVLNVQHRTGPALGYGLGAVSGGNALAGAVGLFGLRR